MRFKKICLLALSLLMIVCTTLGFATISASASDEITFSASDITDSSIKSEYFVNQKISFPQTVELAYGGSKYNATNGIIIYPSGNAYALSTHELTEVGLYTLKYYFTAGNTSVTASTTFVVNTPYFNFVNEDGSTATYVDKSEVNTTGKKAGGLLVDIKPGNVLNFNKPINLNEKNNEFFDATEIFRVNPSTIASFEKVPLDGAKNASEFSYGSIDSTGDVNSNTKKAIVSDYISVNLSDFKCAYEDKLSPNNGTADVQYQLYGYDRAKRPIMFLPTLPSGADGSVLENWINIYKGDFNQYTFTRSNFLDEYGDRIDPYDVVYVRLVVSKVDGTDIADAEFEKLASSVFIHKETYVSTVSTLVFRLTDCYDPSIYVEIILTQAKYGYASVRTNSQEERSLVYNDTKVVVSSYNQTITYIDGEKYVSKVSGVSGQHATDNFSNHQGNSGVQFAFDNETKRVYQAQYKNATDRTYTSYTEANGLICDIADEIVYGDNTFVGFTTGEVYLSVYCDGYNKSSAQVLIHGVGEDGLDGSGESILKNQVGAIYKDGDAPQVKNSVKSTSGTLTETVDGTTRVYNAGTVYAAIGQDVSIPNVEFIDINLFGDKFVNVYRNYDSSEKVKVSQSNGKFKVSYPDTYTIEYKQFDKNNNCAYYLLNVVGSSALDKTIKLTTSKLDSTLNAGGIYTLPTYSIDTLNIKDDISLKITATSEKETIVIDNVTREFVPQYEAKYTINYSYSDNFASDVYSYDVNVVKNSSEIYFSEVPSLPRYLVKGQKYFIDQAYGCKYDTGAPVAKEAKMYIAFAGENQEFGEKTLITDIMNVEIKDSSFARFIYVVDNDETQAYVSAAIPVVNVDYESGGLDVFKYFEGENIDAVDTVYDENTNNDVRASNVKFNITKNTGNEYIRFIKPVDYTRFSFKYRIEEATSNFNSFGFVLTNVNDRTKTFKVEIKREYSVSGALDLKLYIDDKYINLIPKYSFYGNIDNKISYSINSGSLTIGSYSFIVKPNFDSVMCDFDIIIGDIYGDSAITIKEINDQKFNAKKSTDDGKPRCYVSASTGEYAVGEEIVLNIPTFSDVLSQIDYSKVKLTITERGTSNYAKSVDGVIQNGVDNNVFTNYKLVFDKIGSYVVKYDYKDAAGIAGSYQYDIKIVDTTPPVITVKDITEGQTIEVGKYDLFKFEYTIADDISSTANCLVVIYLVDLEFNSNSRPRTNEIQLYKEGMYAVRIIAMDEIGNRTAFEFYLKAQ